MNNKIIAPEGANKNNLKTKSDTTSIPSPPKSQREMRGLKALLNARNGVMRYQMDELVGAQNSPEYISRLRRKGWEIETERVSMIDRDGKRVKVGLYKLDFCQRVLASRVLEGIIHE